MGKLHTFLVVLVEFQRSAIGVWNGELQGAVGTAALYFRRKPQRPGVGRHRLNVLDLEAQMPEQAPAAPGFRVLFVEQFQEGAGGERQQDAVALVGMVAELMDDL